MAINMSSQKYKDANSNYKIKVSEATVAKLRKGTKASNVAAANKTGASAEYREAVSRFYGKGVLKPLGNKFPPTKYPQPEKSKKPVIDPGQRKPTPAEIAQGKIAKGNANKAKLTPNNREDRRSVPSVKPGNGPGGKNVRPKAPAGGPGAKPRNLKPVTPNQRENRKKGPLGPKQSGGPGSKPRTKTYRMKAGG